MKKMVEEAFIMIEQMGYGIIDPVLAHWEVGNQNDSPLDLSCPVLHDKHSPNSFDDSWLQEYEIRIRDSIFPEIYRTDWEALFQEIEEVVKEEGIWAEKDAVMAPLQMQRERSDKQPECKIAASPDDLFAEFAGWPARTVDILSTSDDLRKTESHCIVVELPLKITNRPHHLLVETELPGLINSAARQNPDFSSLLAQLVATGTDTYRVRTSVINGELRLELTK